MRGTVVHKVLEDLFDLPAADRTPERAARLLVPDLGARARGRARARRDVRATRAPTIAAVAGVLPRSRWTATSRSRTRRRLEPAERELYVETLLDSRLLLRGFVDRLDVAPDGAIRVVDYKTGRSPGEAFEAKALFQMKFYALVIWRTRGVVPRDAPAGLPRQRRDAALRPRRGRPAGHRAQGRGDLAGDPRAPRRPATGAPTAAALCDWCAHQSLCPAWGGTPPPLPGRAEPRRSELDATALDRAEDAD